LALMSIKFTVVSPDPVAKYWQFPEIATLLIISKCIIIHAV
jgi:hypothetical protein